MESLLLKVSKYFMQLILNLLIFCPANGRIDMSQIPTYSLVWVSKFWLLFFAPEVTTQQMWGVTSGKHWITLRKALLEPELQKNWLKSVLIYLYKYDTSSQGITSDMNHMMYNLLWQYLMNNWIWSGYAVGYANCSHMHCCIEQFKSSMWRRQARWIT